jgi:deoxyribodipyrimidine photo-lyase
MTTPIAIWWIKRDARLADNAAIHTAIELGLPVLPVFCVEPSITTASDSSVMHWQAERQAVWNLRQRLKKLNADLFIGHGEAVEVFEQLRHNWNVRSIFAHEETGNGLTFDRDKAVTAWCQQHGIGYHEVPQSSVRRGGVNRDRYGRMWQQRIVETQPLPEPTEFPQPAELRDFAAKSNFAPMAFPAIKDLWQPVSEPDAQRTLTDFLTRRGRWYRGGISSPNTAFTAGSRLSVHLAWGTISVRSVWHQTQRRLKELGTEDDRWRKSLEAFISRLHWRDHFTQRLESEPAMEFHGIHPAYANVPYENDPKLLAAWAEGRTGYPMVDAVMRCLAATGFANFRMRAMAVSFACHALHLDWRFIHPHLACVFRDYDPGIHMSQLQMQAGVVGWNPVRVYSPKKQLEDWDSEARFVKTWLPELRDVSAERIVNIDDEPLTSYPPPIVPFGPRTQAMKEILYGLRKTPEAKALTSAVYARHGSRRRPAPKSAKPKQVKKPDPQLRLF